MASDENGQDSVDLAPEQPVWDAVADEIDASSLSIEGRSVLRLWAGEQMREVPGRVWHRQHPQGAPTMRPSFRSALKIAARGIVAGKPPA